MSSAAFAMSQSSVKQCRTPAWGSAEAYAAQLFADALGAGSSSRLFQELREEQGLAYSVSAMAQAHRDCGLFSVYLATDRDDAQWAHGEVERVLADAVATVSDAELARLRWAGSVVFAGYGARIGVRFTDRRLGAPKRSPASKPCTL